MSKCSVCSRAGEHGEWCKHTNFELATHAPMMVSVPGLTEGGVVTEQLTEFVDLFPTLAEAAGLDPVSGVGHRIPSSLRARAPVKSSMCAHDLPAFAGRLRYTILCMCIDCCVYQSITHFLSLSGSALSRVKPHQGRSVYGGSESGSAHERSQARVEGGRLLAVSSHKHRS